MKRRELLKTLIAALLSFATAASTASPACARLVRIVGYDELFSKSDFVAIARPLARTADTTEKTFLPDIAVARPGGSMVKVEAIGEETKFEILQVVKGNSPGKEFILHHMRALDARSVNGPYGVFFDPSDFWGHREILLFLTREKDGRYAPYSGQTDPGFSIFALQPGPVERGDWKGR